MPNHPPSQKSSNTFARQHPEAYVMLNLVRKSLYINPHLVLTLRKEIIISVKEADLYGKTAEKLGWGKLYELKGEKYGFAFTDKMIQKMHQILVKTMMEVDS